MRFTRKAAASSAAGEYSSITRWNATSRSRAASSIRSASRSSACHGSTAFTAGGASAPSANDDGDAHKVLFFFFSRSDKLPKESGLGKDWGEFCADTHRAMIELARSRPDLEIIAKTKGIARQNQELSQALKSGGKEPPSNFRTVSGGDAFQLITESRVVVGFNTTALIEALALGKPVIVPRYGEAKDPDLQKFIIDLGDAVEYADSPRELREMVAVLCEPTRRMTALRPQSRM